MPHPEKPRGLASHAIPAGAASGRLHDEIARSSRPETRRDRDRIFRSKAFLHLDQKTEIYVEPTGGRSPTRLLYAVETASTARSLAELLQLNDEVAEAAVFARALGLPPFGRAGVEALASLMAGHGGFAPAAQSLRVVDELEMKYPEFNGLNLSRFVRESLAPDASSLEAQAAAWSVRITNACLDLEWGLDAGLVDEAALAASTLWREVADPTDREYAKLEAGRRRNYNLRNLLSLLVEDLASASEATAESGSPRIGFASPRLTSFELLEKIVAASVRRSPVLDSLHQRRAACLRELFEICLHRPHLLGEARLVRLKKDGLHRAVADFLASCGDRQLLALREELVGEPLPARKQSEQGVLL